MDQTQAVKTEIINNVMVAMSYYIQQQAVLAALEQVMQKELVRVNMEEITTLPSEKLDQVEERNKYLIQLFMVKKRDLTERDNDKVFKCGKAANTGNQRKINWIKWTKWT